MLNRNALLLVAGAAMLVLNASAATAQTKKTPKKSTKVTSTKRIPISKEPPAEVPPRVDTVTVYRTDTLRMQGRVDTLRLTGPTVTVHDTVIQNVQVLPPMFGGMYFGLGGGPAYPYGSIRTVNEPGYVGQLNLGWQRLHSPLGLRLDGTFTQYAHNADYALLGDQPKVWNLNGDVRLNLPIFEHTLGSAVLFTPYVIGGGSWLYYNNLRVKLEGGNGGIGPQHAIIAGATSVTVIGTEGNSDYESSWGWNAGGGLAFHSGKKEVFVEARWVNFTPKNNSPGSFDKAWHVPITFGVNFF
jgi:hypothetical protein